MAKCWLEDETCGNVQCAENGQFAGGSQRMTLCVFDAGRKAGQCGGKHQGVQQGRPNSTCVTATEFTDKRLGELGINKSST